MTRLFTEEWLADRERKNVTRIGRAQENAQAAATWNGNVEPAKSPPVYQLVGLCRGAGLPDPVHEYSFALPARRWRFDYAWPTHMLALEINGGVWTQGRHTRGQGAIDDMEKLSEAAILGWRVLYAIPDDLRSGLLLDRVERALAPPRRAA